MGLLWGPFGDPSGVLWTPLESFAAASGILWDPLGIICGILLDPLGVLWRSFAPLGFLWVPSGDQVGINWDQVETK